MGDMKADVVHRDEIAKFLNEVIDFDCVRIGRSHG
jgi:hypothetical protein